MWFRRSITSLFAAPIIFSSCSPLLAESVYWNYGIGAVQIGWSPQNNGPIGLKTHIVGIGPDDAPAWLQSCIIEATKSAAIATQKPLDTRIEDKSMIFARLTAGETPPSKQMFDEEVKKQAAATGQIMTGILAHYQAAVESCKKGRPYDPSTIRLGLVTRVCASWLDTVQPCMDARDPVPRTQDQKPGRFAKIHDWLGSIGLNPPVNEMIQLMPLGQQPVSISPNLRDRTYYPALTPEQAQLYFEAGIERLKQKGWKYDYAGLKLAGIDLAVAMALIDRIDSPALAFTGLKNEGRTLQTTSSEIFRTRLRECSLFRGKVTDLEIATCAGIGNEADVIRNCLSGGKCRPTIADKAMGAALTFTDAEGLLSISSPLPRILSEVPLPQQFAVAETCAKQYDDESDFTICFTKSQVTDPKSRAALDCVQLTEQGSKMNCMLDAVGGEEMAKARCFLDAKDNAARARCLIATDSPKHVVQAVECANRPGATFESTASCIVSKNIPGDAGRVVECAGSSGGNVFGAAICLAGDDLTPEQRILLQCGAQSFEPASYGICVGGQLLVKEFVNCRDKNFGEGDCFGENNEIRKFIRNIGLGDIQENTVVAHMLNAPLEVVKFGVTAAEGIVNALGDLAEDVAEGVADLIDGLASGISDVFSFASADIGNINCEPEDDLCKFTVDVRDAIRGNLVGKDLDTASATLTVKDDGTVTLTDGSKVASFKTDNEITSPQELQQLAETITAAPRMVVSDDLANTAFPVQANETVATGEVGVSPTGQDISPVWVEVAPTGKGDTTRIFKLDLEASLATKDTARAIEMQALDLKALETLNFDKTVLEQIRQFEQGGLFGQ